MIRLIQWVITIFVLIFWAVVGFLLWIPFLTRMILAFMGSIIASMYRDTDPDLARHGLETAITFYARGFKTIINSMSSSPRTGKMPPGDTLALRTVVVEMGLATVFWVTLLVGWHYTIGSLAPAIAEMLKPDPPQIIAKRYWCGTRDCDFPDFKLYANSLVEKQKEDEQKVKEAEDKLAAFQRQPPRTVISYRYWCGIAECEKAAFDKYRAEESKTVAALKAEIEELKGKMVVAKVEPAKPKESPIFEGNLRNRQKIQEAAIEEKCGRVNVTDQKALAENRKCRSDEGARLMNEFVRKVDSLMAGKSFGPIRMNDCAEYGFNFSRSFCAFKGRHEQQEIVLSIEEWKGLCSFTDPKNRYEYRCWVE